MGKPSSTTDDAPLPESAVGAAHDLRNVLFVISAHSLRLLQTVEASDAGFDDLQAIKDAADRGMALARQMLAASHAAAPPRPVDPNDVIRGVEPLLRRLVGDRIHLVLRLGGGIWPVHASTIQIEQVVMNLAVNARDAMPDGGQLTIATENRAVTTAGAAAPSHHVVVSVTDTGIGMDQALQARIFEPHFTTKRDAGGTGLGLGIVRSIAAGSGGHVELSSAVGEGTTMRVVLPRAEAVAESIATPEADVPALAPASATDQRILLVEDEAGVREMLQRWLALQGYDVVLASGVEAMELCAAGDERIDVVVTDLHLPDVPGLSIVRRLHERRPDVPIVLMSGQADALEQGAADECTSLLTKPFSLAELTEAVRNAAALSARRAEARADRTAQPVTVLSAPAR